MPRSGPASSPSARKEILSSGCATMPAPRPVSGSVERSKTWASIPRCASASAASRPLIEPPITSARKPCGNCISPPTVFCYSLSQIERENAMAMSMKEKASNSHVDTEWPAALKQEFKAEGDTPNGCVGNALLSETDKVRVWTIRLKPGQRFGFHRHVLNYFWTAVTPCRGRQHLMDGTTVEYSYYPGETRHETYGSGEFKVHDLENIGDADMVFMTVEFIEGSANTPLAIPDTVRLKAA